MKALFVLFALLSANAFALGTIPNGTYAGKETCGDKSYSDELTFADTTLTWDGQVNSFEFIGEHPNGFFRVSTLDGMKGAGLGHLTSDGFHYEIIFDYPKDGKIVPAPGEDTFTYKDGVVHLVGTASAGKDGKVLCTGDFAVVR